MRPAKFRNKVAGHLGGYYCPCKYPFQGSHLWCAFCFCCAAQRRQRHSSPLTNPIPARARRRRITVAPVSDTVLVIAKPKPRQYLSHRSLFAHSEQALNFPCMTRRSAWISRFCHHAASEILGDHRGQATCCRLVAGLLQRRYPEESLGRSNCSLTW